MDTGPRPTLPPFLLFGMGSRAKYVLSEGTLREALSTKVIRDFGDAAIEINAAEYRVQVQGPNGSTILIFEDSDGIWLQEGTALICLSDGQIHLPDFNGNRYAAILRVLHQEVLVNIANGFPVPNIFVYNRPWYRDSAMTAMVLERTDNTHLIREWVEGIREPFDYNNGGESEPDNLGQLLYLFSLTSGQHHPALERVLEAATRFRQGNHLRGNTDHAPRPVYQTQWMKFGLARLNLSDPYELPDDDDAYRDLCWWADARESIHDSTDQLPPHDWKYPYLTWARVHYHGSPPPMDLLGTTYPLTWESKADLAGYAGMAWVHKEYCGQRLAAPHSWHAAEAFLYLEELGRPDHT